MHYLLFYDYAPDYLERRAQFREEHLALAWEAQARGELVLAGALAEPADMGCCCSIATALRCPSGLPLPIRMSGTVW